VSCWRPFDAAEWRDYNGAGYLIMTGGGQGVFAAGADSEKVAIHSIAQAAE